MNGNRHQHSLAPDRTGSSAPPPRPSLSVAEDLRRMQAVLVHDWLTGMRGGERVLELLCEVFADAPIYTLIHNPAAVSETINRHPIFPSFLQRVPGIFTRYRLFLPLFPVAAESLSIPPADIVISTSHCVAKGVRVPRGTPHLCYCFTPMRYVWVFPRDYFGSNPLVRAASVPLLRYLRSWDLRSSNRVDLFVAISQHVQRRIEVCYHRPARVVYPPVNLDFFTPDPRVARGEFDLIVSALVPYKRIDIAIKAYNQLRFPLRIVGTGTEYRKLKTLAASNIEFLGQLPDEDVRNLYRRARFVIFPGEEDFGLVPLEAQACGTPVIAFDRGGVQETVVAGRTGYLFDSQNPQSLAAAVERAAAQEWDPAVIRKNAEKFSVNAFLDGLTHCVTQCIQSRP
ncbi:MAG: glycosyltransferase family 4 protein [Verrucomicrobia bacterium]|nr:MAG: glycosyltransferase family 4 protein [Verrucomicrobiota bacterium]